MRNLERPVTRGQGRKLLLTEREPHVHSGDWRAVLCNHSPLCAEIVLGRFARSADPPRRPCGSIAAGFDLPQRNRSDESAENKADDDDGDPSYLPCDHVARISGQSTFLTKPEQSLVR